MWFVVVVEGVPLWEMWCVICCGGGGGGGEARERGQLSFCGVGMVEVVVRGGINPARKLN